MADSFRGALESVAESGCVAGNVKAIAGSEITAGRHYYAPGGREFNRQCSESDGTFFLRTVRPYLNRRDFLISQGFGCWFGGSGNANKENRVCRHGRPVGGTF